MDQISIVRNFAPENEFYFPPQHCTHTHSAWKIIPNF